MLEPHATPTEAAALHGWARDHARAVRLEDADAGSAEATLPRRSSTRSALTARGRALALLQRAVGGSGPQQPAAALPCYWDARRAARFAGDARLLSLADFGIAVICLDVGRRAEGLEALKRAICVAKNEGFLLLRGCGELVMADLELEAGRLDEAIRGLDVAADLLAASGAPELSARALTLRAAATWERSHLAGAPADRHQAAPSGI